MCHPLESDFDMSRKIVDRVWQHSHLSGANKLLLLALAEQADDDGFTWVGYKTLAPMLGVIERQVYRLVDNLIEKGEAIVWEQQGQHGGRGYTNIYLVTTGLTQEQIAETVKRRFDLVSDEVEAVITKKGDTYIKLCDVKRISPATLERTRKGDTYVIVDEKPDTNVTLNPVKGDVSVTQLNEAKPVKPDTNVTRLLEDSLDLESNPSKESKRERESHAHKLERIGEVDYLSQNEPFAVKLSEICGNPHPRYVVNGNRKKLAEATAQLLDWDATIDQLDKFKAVWPFDSPPYFHQVTGGWGRFLTSLQQTTNGANQNGHYSKPNPQRNTDPDRIPSVDIFEDGWQPPSRSLS